MWQMQMARVARKMMLVRKLRVYTCWAEHSRRQRHTRGLGKILGDRKRKSIMGTLFDVLHSLVAHGARSRQAETALNLAAIKWAIRDSFAGWRQGRTSAQLESKIRVFWSTRLRWSLLKVIRRYRFGMGLVVLFDGMEV